MVDTNPTDPTAYTTQPLHAPAAPLSAEEIAEMRRELDAVGSKSGADFLLYASRAAQRMPRLLSALEALTADRNRLRDALTRTVQEACAAIDDELKPEVKRLTAENARLVGLARDAAAIGDWVCAVDRDRFEDPLCRLGGWTGYVRLDRVRHLRDEGRRALGMEVGWMIEGAVKAMRKVSVRDESEAPATKEAEREADMQEIAGLGQAMQPELHPGAADCQLLGNPEDVGWYARHRAAVEAAHAAAKQAKREAECRNCRDGFPAYINPADWNTCPDCGKRPGGTSDEAEGLRPLTPDDIASHSYLLTRSTETAR